MSAPRFVATAEGLPAGLAYALYGTGAYADRVRREIEDAGRGCELVCYVDSFEGGERDGIPVYPLEQIERAVAGVDRILIASSFWREIEDDLRARRMQEYSVVTLHPNDLRSIMERLQPVSPYAGFPREAFTLDLQGWFSDHPVFRELALRLRPREIVEVGTWKGASALHLAGLLRELEQDATLVCVDTWLGSSEHWLNAELGPLRFGRPQLYEQFLANVIHAGMEQTIRPLPLASLAAAQLLARSCASVDLVYLDAGHSFEEVYGDACAWYEVLRPGGVLLGDDWDWPGVRQAAQRLAAEKGLDLETRGQKWLVEKR